MLSVARRAITRDILLEKKSVSVSDLARRFNVTEETIRRDLKALEAEGFLTRTYGGAFIQDGSLNEIDVSVLQTAYVDEKKRMAEAAAKLVRNGDSVYIDSSTSAGFLCGYIKDRRVTVVTNSLMVLNSLQENRNISLVSIGGKYEPSSMSFVGSEALSALRRYFVDHAFFSCRSVSAEHGLTDANSASAAIRSLLLEQSEHTSLLADHTKFGKSSFMSVGPLSRLDNVFTDAPLNSEWQDTFSKNHVRVYECSSGQ